VKEGFRWYWEGERGREGYLLGVGRMKGGEEGRWSGLLRWRRSWQAMVDTLIVQHVGL